MMKWFHETKLRGWVRKIPKLCWRGIWPDDLLSPFLEICVNKSSSLVLRQGPKKKWTEHSQEWHLLKIHSRGRGSYYTLGLDGDWFFGPWAFIILKSTNQDLSNEGSKIVLSSLGLSVTQAIRVFESHYYVFGNLSFLSIYSEVLGYALLCETLDRTVFPTLWLLDPRNWIELNSFLLFFHLTFESSIFMAMTLRKMSWLKLIKLRKKTTLVSGINVAPGINIATGTFGKTIKRSP